MRVYRLLSTEYGLLALRNQRLKVATFDDLNDPFELLSAKLSTPQLRRAVSGFKTFMQGKLGILCFGSHWKSSVIWSHYADKHRGMCLGFDIPDDSAIPVRYVGARAALRFQNDVESEGVETQFALDLLRSKFKGWKYEEEVRMYVDLDADTQVDEGLHFFRFGDELQLREVILGPNCPLTLAEIRAQVELIRPRVTLTKARLAFRTFNVVANRAAT